VLNTDLTNKVDTANDTGCVFRFFFANVLAWLVQTLLCWTESIMLLIDSGFFDCSGV
jgi:hypothetical protein